MKRLFLILAAVVAAAVLSLVAYRGYRFEASTSGAAAAVSSDQSQAQGRLLARLRFDPATFGGCSVHDAWLELSSTALTRSWFGIRLGAETVPSVVIRVVLDVPKDPFGSADSLSFDETNPKASDLGLTGSVTQTIAIDGTRYWLFESNTVFPPPAAMKFSCGAAQANATQVTLAN